jgi:hypothetical protein
MALRKLEAAPSETRRRRVEGTKMLFEPGTPTLQKPSTGRVHFCVGSTLQFLANFFRSLDFFLFLFLRQGKKRKQTLRPHDLKNPLSLTCLNKHFKRKLYLVTQYVIVSTSPFPAETLFPLYHDAHIPASIQTYR